MSAAASSHTLAAAQPTKKKIIINNRVLANVNGKAISVIDVMKKMDMILYQRYPQYLDVPEARYQFYTTTWKKIFSDLVDRELIIADAEEKNFEVSSGDVREEMEEIFGPHMMLNLHNAGLTFEEAWQMVKADIVIRRMLHYQVRSRIYSQITTQEVRDAYDVYAKKNNSEKEYVWQAISLRAPRQDLAASLGQLAYRLLAEEKIPVDALEAKIQANELWQPQVSIAISTLYTQKQRDLSTQLQELFASLEEGMHSKPLLQVSKSDQTPVVRIYYLQQIKQAQTASLHTMWPQLKEEIAQMRIEQETEVYFASLHRHFHLSKNEIEQQLPAQFQPFELR